uniref:Uncharacterized protein n=2 Tax=Euplotes harpa TaxID=151035 RepID=A0A7S3N8J1_9SPIT|mmetsp:Transcript_33809/g.38970  ORF Transcript_33809/g.38970 Transcript_33809/m.38970 type:complete len:113 (+) Transcript_33809:100-438(+)
MQEAVHEAVVSRAEGMLAEVKGWMQRQGEGLERVGREVEEVRSWVSAVMWERSNGQGFSAKEGVEEEKDDEGGEEEGMRMVERMKVKMRRKMKKHVEVKSEKMELVESGSRK